MEISKRVQDMQYSPIRCLVPNLEAAIARGVKVHQMHIGQPDIKTPDAYFEGVRNFKEEVIAYTNSRGVPQLLDAFSNYYTRLGIDFSPEEILITSGGSEALIFTIATICDPGDEVIIFEPFYTNYVSFLKLGSAEAVPIRLKSEDDYRITGREMIEAKITSRTKAIMLSNPSNPLGTVLTAEEMQIICDVARKHGLYIIADEVYRHFVYDGAFYQSFMSFEDMRQQIILVDSVSKHFSACGARIGAVASKNREFIAQVLKLCQMRLCVSTIEQFANAALINDVSDYLKDTYEIYKSRRDAFCEALAKVDGVKFAYPRAAFYVFCELPVDDTEKFAKWILDEFERGGETLSFAPGGGFYADSSSEKNKARFSFCASAPDELERAVEILAKGIEVYNSR